MLNTDQSCTQKLSVTCPHHPSMRFCGSKLWSEGWHKSFLKEEKWSDWEGKPEDAISNECIAATHVYSSDKYYVLYYTITETSKGMKAASLVLKFLNHEVQYIITTLIRRKCKEARLVLKFLNHEV